MRYYHLNKTLYVSVELRKLKATFALTPSILINKSMCYPTYKELEFEFLLAYWVVKLTFAWEPK